MAPKDTDTLSESTATSGPAPRVNAELLPAAVVLACAVLLVAASTLLNPGSSFVRQLDAVLVTGIFLVVASFGQGLTILLGGIDLSIGVVIGLAALMVSTLTNGHNPAIIWAVPATLGFAAFIGLVNGLGVALAGMPPFIMTLASSISFFGVGLAFTSGLAQRPVAPGLVSMMGAHVAGVPIPVLLLLAFAIVATIFQNYTSDGRKLYAVGSSPGAARVLGLPIAGLNILVYTLSGLCAGVSGILLAGYSSAATINIGDALLLPTIAAVVIGGARVVGGRGIYLGTFAGALFLSALETIITVLNLSQGVRDVIEGVIIVGALLLQSERWRAGRR
ncbi:MAG: ABC transporter permease [Acetobacteraceae bacterium]